MNLINNRKFDLGGLKDKAADYKAKQALRVLYSFQHYRSTVIGNHVTI